MVVRDPVHCIVFSLALGSDRDYVQITSQRSLSDAAWPSACMAPYCQRLFWPFGRDPGEKLLGSCGSYLQLVNQDVLFKWLVIGIGEALASGESPVWCWKVKREGGLCRPKVGCASKPGKAPLTWLWLGLGSSNKESKPGWVRTSPVCIQVPDGCHMMRFQSSSACTMVLLWRKPTTGCSASLGKIPSLLSSQLSVCASPCSLLCCLSAFENISRVPSVL